MLEIKCPVSRDIHTKGTIVGDICPFYYYCQIQQQLVCCELDFCDFWQCKLTEYNNRDEYLLDGCEDSINAEGVEGIEIEINPLIKKGMILEFLPKVYKPQYEDDKIEWKAKYVYAKSLDLTTSQYNDWVLTTIDKYTKQYPDIAKDYYFSRIVYWKLQVSHNVTIPRDDVFFGSILPVLKDTWSKVLYYRKNKDKLDELRAIVNKRKKYVKMDLTYTIANKKIIETKFDFLSNTFDKNLLITEKVPVKNSYYKKFNKKPEETITNEYNDTNTNCDFID
jgi:hypothetical protein